MPGEKRRRLVGTQERESDPRGVGHRHPGHRREPVPLRLVLRSGRAEEVLLVPIDAAALLPVLVLEPLPEEAPDLHVRANPRDQHHEHPDEEAPECNVREGNLIERVEAQVERDPLPSVPTGEERHQDEDAQDARDPGEPAHRQFTAVGASDSRPEKVAPVVAVSSAGT